MTSAYQNFMEAFGRLGAVNAMNTVTANGMHSHRNHGRLWPHLVFVWSTMEPHTTAEMASAKRATSRMVAAPRAPEAAMPNTSV